MSSSAPQNFFCFLANFDRLPSVFVFDMTRFLIVHKYSNLPLKVLYSIATSQFCSFIHFRFLLFQSSRSLYSLPITHMLLTISKCVSEMFCLRQKQSVSILKCTAIEKKTEFICLNPNCFRMTDDDVLNATNGVFSKNQTFSNLLNSSQIYFFIH